LKPGNKGFSGYKITQLQNYKIFWAAVLLEKRFSYRAARGGAV
jgi:hypothetical protein